MVLLAMFLSILPRLLDLVLRPQAFFVLLDTRLNAVIKLAVVKVHVIMQRHAFLEHLRAHVLSFTIYKSNLAVILINTLNLQADYACVQQFA